jgi:hypothetical protein
MCAKMLDGALAMTGLKAPQPGDATLCAGCGSWVIFTELLTLRMPTEDEQAVIALDRGAQRAWRVWRATHRR